MAAEWSGRVADMRHSVKYVPEWVPGAGFQIYAKEAREDSRQVRDKPMEVVMAEMVSCLGRSCSLSVQLF
jgi:hypothetical protein